MVTLDLINKRTLKYALCNAISFFMLCTYHGHAFDKKDDDNDCLSFHEDKLST